jgi:hypothetical protein
MTFAEVPRLCLEKLSMAKQRPTFPEIMQRKARLLQPLDRRRFEFGAPAWMHAALIARCLAGAAVF